MTMADDTMTMAKARGGVFLVPLKSQFPFVARIKIMETNYRPIAKAVSEIRLRI